MPTMKANLRAELDLLNRNVDEMIRLCQCATDTGVWARQEAQRPTARLESFRTKLNADFQELTGSHERANASWISTQNANKLTKK
jgi:hypothetical protein